MKSIIFIILIFVAEISFAGGSAGTMGASSSAIRESIRISK